MQAGTEFYSDRTGRQVGSSNQYLGGLLVRMTWDKTGPFGFTVNRPATVYVFLRCERSGSTDLSVYTQPATSSLLGAGFAQASTDMSVDAGFSSVMNCVAGFPLFYKQLSANTAFSVSIDVNANYGTFALPQ